MTRPHRRRCARARSAIGHATLAALVVVLVVVTGASCGPPCPPGAVTQVGWNFEDSQCGADPACGFTTSSGRVGRVEVFPGEHALDLAPGTSAVYTGPRPASLALVVPGPVTLSARCDPRSSLSVQFLDATSPDADTTTNVLAEVLVGPDGNWRTFGTTLPIVGDTVFAHAAPITIRVSTVGPGRCQLDNVLYNTDRCPQQ